MLAIETGRWTKTEVENRLCKQCTQNEIEDKKHFLFRCQKHSEERMLTFQLIKAQSNIDLSDKEHEIENIKLLFISDHLTVVFVKFPLGCFFGHPQRQLSEFLGVRKNFGVSNSPILKRVERPS